MQSSVVITALFTAAAFGVGGWYLGAKTGKVAVLTHAHKSKDCKGKDCDVTIKFDCVDPSKPATCEPYAEEEVILTTSKHKIEFNIDKSTSYEFDTDGIKFTSANSNGWFDCKADGKQKYTCDISKDTPADLYKYSIRVKGMDVADPWIVNY